eukprot:g1715.t1
MGQAVQFVAQFLNKLCKRKKYVTIQLPGARENENEVRPFALTELSVYGARSVGSGGPTPTPS